MSSLWIWLPVALGIAVWMDVWAALLHGLVWHRVLWPIHRSHHLPRRGRYEKNDALSVLHAPIAIALILYGCMAEPGTLREIVFGVGIGMTLFGVSYFVVHDGLVHGRLPVGFLLRVGYLRRVVEAHRKHHEGSRGRAPYGLFFGPLELRLANRRGLPPPASRPLRPGHAARSAHM